MDQVTDVGVATAVAVTVPAVALAANGCQLAGSTHNQVGKLTTL